MPDDYALIAYEQPHRLYTTHESFTLASNLAQRSRLTPNSPFGATEYDRTSPLVDPVPLEEDISFPQLLDSLDYTRYRYLITLTTDFQQTIYRTVSLTFDPDAAGEGRGIGAIVELPYLDTDPDRDQYRCAYLDALREELQARIDDGAFTSMEACEFMREELARHQGSDRRVRFATGQTPGRVTTAIAELVTANQRPWRNGDS